MAGSTEFELVIQGFFNWCGNTTEGGKEDVYQDFPHFFE